MTVTASDGALSVKQTIAVTVVSNRAPIAVGTIPSQTLTVGRGTAEVDVSNKFTDPDGTTLSYSATSNAKSKATVGVSDATVTITPVAAGSGTITVTASDGTATATQSISITVDANTAPKGSPISARTLTVGTDETVDASLYFSDADGDTLTYTASSSDSSKATTSQSGSTITITPKAVGNVTITVIARDGISSASQPIAVTVRSKPQAVGTIQDMTVSMTKGPESLDVSGYFKDDDGDTLNYTASSDDTSKATVGALGSTVTITPKAAGDATITVKATDPSNNSATQDIDVTVVANRAPTAVGTIPSQTVNVGGNAKALNVSSYFSDPDGQNLSYTATSSATDKATVSVSGAIVTITGVATGTATITVTATDGTDTTTQTISATMVIQPNRAPTAVGTIPSQTVTVDGSAKTVTVGGYFSDADGDTLTYTASSSDTAKATASVSGSTVSITPVATGTTTITVTATDPDSESVTQSFSVTVANSQNRAPTTIGSILEQTVTVGKSSATVDLSSYFSDPDGDTLTYTAASSNTGVASASLSGTQVSITAVAAGKSTVTVKATDPGGLFATQSIPVTVYDLAALTGNRSPVAVGTISAQRLNVGKATIMNVASYFKDADKDKLTYAAVPSDVSIATVSVSGALVTITGAAGGTTTVTVMAADPHGLSATQAFTVTVNQPNRAPTAVGTIPAQTLTVGKSAKTVNVSANFSDPDGDTLTYTASSSATNRVTVSDFRFNVKHHADRCGDGDGNCDCQRWQPDWNPDHRCDGGWESRAGGSGYNSRANDDSRWGCRCESWNLLQRR